MGLVAYLSLSGSGREVGWGGHLFETGRLLTFSAFRMGAYSRWALIRGWALIRINTVSLCFLNVYRFILELRPGRYIFPFLFVGNSRPSYALINFQFYFQFCA